MIGRLLIGVVAMEGSFALLHFAPRPPDQVGLVLLSYLVCNLTLAWLIWQFRRHPQRLSRSALTVVLVGGVVFRLTLLPLPPATSPDVIRYLWEGVVQRLGFNPYVSPPSAPELAPVEAAYPKLAEAVNHPSVHPELAAIYPPVAQMLFRLNAALFDGRLLGWKLILLVFDGLLALSLWHLLRERQDAVAGLTAVFWCPLLLLECYEGAHLDLIGVTLLVLAVLAFQRRHALAAGVALGLAIDVKYLWPLVAFVLLVRPAFARRRGVVFCAATLLVAALAWLPYRDGLGDALATVRYFAEHWTFNDLAFEALRQLPGPRWLPMAVVLAVLTALAGCLARRRAGEEVWPDVWLLCGTALLLGPVAYPWYFLWIVPGLALTPPLWLILWVLSVPALHLVHWQYVATGQWDPMVWLWPLVDALPAVLLIRGWWRRLTRPAALHAVDGRPSP